MHGICDFTFLGLAALLLTGCATTPEHSADPRPLVERFVAASNAHDYDQLDALLAAGVTRHCQATPGVQVHSRAEMLAFLKHDAVTFPDGHVTLTRTTVEGDRVAFQGTYTGTQTGPMGPFPPTQKTMELDISGSFRIEGERIAEIWIVWDNLAALTQLGHWPPAVAPADALARDEANKALARVWFEEVITARDLDAIDEHYAPTYVHHGPEGAVLRGLPAARAVAAGLLRASSDRVAVVEQQVAQGDLVVTRFTSRGTHDGTFRGQEPTGKEWITEGICISRIEAGQIAEDWEIIHSSGL